MDTQVDDILCLYFSFQEDGRLEDKNSYLLTLLGYDGAVSRLSSIDQLLSIASNLYYQTQLLPMLRLQGRVTEISLTLKTINGQTVPVLVNAWMDTKNSLAVIRCAGIAVPKRTAFEGELMSARKNAEQAQQENRELIKTKKQLYEHTLLLNQQMTEIKSQHVELMQLNHVLSHDLQEPIRKLRLFSNKLLFEHPVEADRKLRQSLEKIDRVTEQMHATASSIQQYLWVNDTQSARGPIVLDDLLMAAHQQVEKEMGLTLEMTSSELGSIEGIADHFRLLFYHLLKNAVQFRIPGQPARVSVQATVLERNRLQELPAAYEYVSVLKITFTDEGIGIDPRNKEQLFDLFKRFDRASGRGVGLALCRKIVEYHGGTIMAGIPAKGRGAILTIIFPIS